MTRPRSHSEPSADKPITSRCPLWLKGLGYLLVYSGYVIIHRTDESEVVIDIDQSPPQRARESHNRRPATREELEQQK